jgi:hypothetical protein
MKHFIARIVQKQIFTRTALIKEVEIIIVLSDSVAVFVDHLFQVFDHLLLFLLFHD